MKVIIAPQSFKGTLSAVEAAEAIERGILTADPSAKTVKLPVSDGGDGFLEILLNANNGKLVQSTVTGPLGDQIAADWGVVENGRTAVIELAKVCGLAMIPRDRLNPKLTTTYGVGEVILEALDRGIRKFIIGLGGSGTSDAGVGIVQALGVSFIDAGGQELPHGGEALSNLSRFDLTGMDKRIKECEILIACDVTNPFTGPEGAVKVYARQKGAAEEDVEGLERGFINLQKLIKEEMGIDLGAITGAGAAGGAAGGLHAFLGGRLHPGIDMVLDQVHFDDNLRDADVVITGEGKLDAQTVYDKGPVGVSRRAKGKKVPVLAIVGSLGEGYRDVHQHGIEGIMPLSFDPSYEGNKGNAQELVASAAEEVYRIFNLKENRLWQKINS